MIKLASSAGASAIKFQMHVLEDEMLKEHLNLKILKRAYMML